MTSRQFWFFFNCQPCRMGTFTLPKPRPEYKARGAKSQPKAGQKRHKTPILPNNPQGRRRRGSSSSGEPNATPASAQGLFPGARRTRDKFLSRPRIPTSSNPTVKAWMPKSRCWRTSASGLAAPRLAPPPPLLPTPSSQILTPAATAAVLLSRAAPQQPAP